MGELIRSTKRIEHGFLRPAEEHLDVVPGPDGSLLGKAFVHGALIGDAREIPFVLHPGSAAHEFTADGGHPNLETDQHLVRDPGRGKR